MSFSPLGSAVFTPDVKCSSSGLQPADRLAHTFFLPSFPFYLAQAVRMSPVPERGCDSCVGSAPAQPRALLCAGSGGCTGGDAPQIQCTAAPGLGLLGALWLWPSLSPGGWLFVNIHFILLQGMWIFFFFFLVFNIFRSWPDA